MIRPGILPKTSLSGALLVTAGLLLAALPAYAQRPPQPGPQEAPPAAPQGAAEAPQQQAAPRWESFPPMVLERVFRGPLRDTLVQRWRDPVDGAICFVYLPISVSAAGQSAYLLYGSNTIGSISCTSPAQVIQLQGIAAAPTPAPAPSAPAPAQPPARGR